jgi:hypothetical protein
MAREAVRQRNSGAKNENSARYDHVLGVGRVHRTVIPGNRPTEDNQGVRRGMAREQG